MSRSALMAVVALSGASNLLGLASSLFVLQIYDRVLATRSGALLAFLGAVFVAMLVAAGLLEYVRARILVREGNLIERDLTERHGLWAVSQGDGTEHDQAPDPSMCVRRLFGSPVAGAAFDVAWSPIFLAGLFILHSVLGWAAAVLGVAVAACAWAAQKSNARWQERCLACDRADVDFVRAACAPYAVRPRDSFAALISTHWSKLRLRALVSSSRSTDSALAFQTALRTLRSAIQVLVLAVAAWLAIRAEVTPGAIFAASILAGRAVGPIEGAAVALRLWQEARPHIARARQSRLVPVGPQSELRAAGASDGPVVSLRDVMAPAVPGGPLVLKGISLELARTEVLGIMGPIGSGKSTVLRLLIGDVRPISGHVRTQWSREGGTPQVRLGFLPQHPAFLPGTVAQNIAGFDPAAKREAVVLAASRAGLLDVGTTLNAGLDTEIDALGRPLTQGQRQILALARSIFGDPKVIVLDMPESHLGPDGERRIGEIVDTLRDGGAAVILASHAPRLLRHASRIALMREGHIVKMLTPTDLLTALRDDGRLARSA